MNLLIEAIDHTWMLFYKYAISLEGHYKRKMYFSNMMLFLR